MEAGLVAPKQAPTFTSFDLELDALLTQTLSVGTGWKEGIPLASLENP